MPTQSSLPLGLQFVAETPVPGLAVAERRVEDPEGTIVCAHGGLDRGGSFARLARRTDLFDFVTYDRRGYQGSRELHPLTFDAHVEDLLAIARREHERGPVILFGHSYGGVIALGAAVEDAMIAQLAIVYETPLPWIVPRKSSRAPLSDDPRAEAERFFRRMVSKGAWERLSERERESRLADGTALLSDLTSLQHGAPYDLTRLAVPTTYVYGDGMIVDYYRALCGQLMNVNPTIRCRELENAGHGAHLSSPDLLARMIDEEWRRECESV